MTAKLLYAGLIGLLLSCYLSLIAHAGSVWTDCIDSKEPDLIAAISDYREANGLNRLGTSDALSASAEHMVQDMSHYDYFGHYTANGTSWSDNQRNHGYDDNTWRGQNLSGGQPTAQRVLHAWIESPTHKAILLNPNWVSVGVGYTRRDGTTYTYYWAADFGGAPDAPANAC